METNSIEVQDQILLPETNKLFNGPEGKYYTSLRNLDDSSNANCTIHHGLNDQKKSFTLKPNETIYYPPEMSKKGIWIENEPQEKRANGPKIEVKFYYQSTNDQKASFKDRGRGFSFKYYNCPGEYLVKLYYDHPETLTYLKICDGIDHCNEFTNIDGDENLYIVQMTVAEVRFYTKDPNVSYNLDFYTHIT